jgi:hypothetical protein
MWYLRGKIGFKARWVVLGIILALVASCAFVAIFSLRSMIGQNAARLQREHGLQIPESAAFIQCRGDAWKLIIDRGALGMFTITEADLGGFLSQLTIKSRVKSTVKYEVDPSALGAPRWAPSIGTFIPSNVAGPPLQNPIGKNLQPIEAISADSSTGDWMHIELFRVDDETVLMKIYTDWN